MIRGEIRDPGVDLFRRIVITRLSDFSAEDGGFLELYDNYFRLLGISDWKTIIKQEASLDSLPDIMGYDAALTTRILSLPLSSRYYELTGLNSVRMYNLGECSQSMAQQSLLVLQKLHQPIEVKMSISDLFSEVLSEERKGKSVVVANLPVLGIIWPPLYASIMRDEESLEQEVMEHVLGFVPPCYEADVTLR